jgi:hypothetical protein
MPADCNQHLIESHRSEVEQMGFPVWVTQRNESKQVEWGLGECTCCKSVVAVRIEQVTEVTSLYFIPIDRKRVGRLLRCDFCEREVDRCIVQRVIAHDEWAPKDGLSSLAHRIAAGPGMSIPDHISESQLDSLLSAVHFHSAPANVDIRAGITIGAVAGPAIAVPIGLALFDTGWIRPPVDRTGVAIGAALFGIVIGVIVCAMVHAFLKCGSVAYNKIRRAQRDYRLDPPALENAGAGYNRRIRRAVRRVRDDAGFDNPE